MNHLHCIVFVTLAALALAPANAQDDASATAAEAANVATDSKQTSDEALKAAKQAQATAEDKAQKAEQAADDAARKQADAAADVQGQIDAQAALLATQTASARETETSIVDLQRALDEQKKLIETQKQEIEKQRQQIEQQQAQLQTTSELLTNIQSQVDQLQQDKVKELSDEDVAMRDRLAKLETQVGRIPEDPSAILADESFPGAIRVPGTNASYKIGGFVKATLVNNFDPLVTQDRFITGSIPVTDNDQTALASETSLTANQSRINFDYRQKRQQGNLRAFIEADFAGDGDTFRLRHAFGQYRDLLAGKTWSAFYDAQAAPEEVDFEGINGHVVVRQTQARYFPSIGKDWRWMISLEDPAPEVTGGTGVSDLPDFITSIRRQWFNRWHLKTALLLRQLRAIPNAGVNQDGQECDPDLSNVPDPTTGLGCRPINSDGSTQKEFGWAITASGKVQIPIWNKNDNLLFQLNYGEGLGRYLTDLSSIASLGIDGGQDAVINPANGDMKALPVFGGYVAFQHWWRSGLRSTFIFSLVNIDNLDSQSPQAYHETQRWSANLIWSPINNMDLGGEFLWGKRINKSNSPESPPAATPGAREGTATQLQLEAVYRF